MRTYVACFALVLAGVSLASCGHEPSGGSSPETAGPSAAIDYGPLGKPDADNEIDQRSAAENLKLFRGADKNPPQGTETQPIDWMTIIELGMKQRALFYAAESKDPSPITDQDRKWLKADEDAVLSEACGERGSPGNPLELTEKQCAGVS